MALDSVNLEWTSPAAEDNLASQSFSATRGEAVDIVFARKSGSSRVITGTTITVRFAANRNAATSLELTATVSGTSFTASLTYAQSASLVADSWYFQAWDETNHELLSFGWMTLGENSDLVNSGGVPLIDLYVPLGRTITINGTTQSLADNRTWTLAAADVGAQPLDADLTAIAALSTTSFGRSLLTQADAAATRSTIGAGTSSFSGAFSDLSGKPTTLSGYGITDAASDSELSSHESDTTNIHGITDTSALVTLTGTQILTNKTLVAPVLTNPLDVPNGGSGLSAVTPYAVLCGGTTETGKFQPVGSVGTSGQVLTSNGAGALPTFQNAPSRASLGLATTDSPQFAAINLGHASDTPITRASSGVVSVPGITCTGGGTQSEQFGAGASTGGKQNCVAIGYGATVTSSDTYGGAVVIGKGASAKSHNCVAIGSLATATSGDDAFALGYSATAGEAGTAIGSVSTAASGCVAAGNASSATGDRSVSVGKSATDAGYAQCVALGYSATADRNGQLVWCARDYSTPQFVVKTNADNYTPYAQYSIDSAWASSAAATRKGRAVLNAWDTAARECIRIEASGTAAMIGFFGAAAVVQQTSGANLTNNVTSGGTNDTIANFTDLTVYANDAAAIRNNIYQLARKLKQVNDALRSLGLLS